MFSHLGEKIIPYSYFYYYYYYWTAIKPNQGTQGTTNRTYVGKLKHLLQSDEGSIFRLHAVVAPISSHGGHVHRIIIIIVVIMIVVVREEDPKLIDVAKVVIAKVFRVVTAREQHVAKQVLSKGFLLGDRECVQQNYGTNISDFGKILTLKPFVTP